MTDAATARVLDDLRAGRLQGTRELKLRGGLTEFPREVFNVADTLEVLDLSGNSLDALPGDFARLRRLRIVFGSDNRFTRLPDVLGDCPLLEMVGFKANRIEHVSAAALPPLLRWLILTDNRIAELPAELGHRPRLQKLMLAGNALTTLPPQLAGCDRLELLRIAGNRLDALPDWLLALPRLAWLAFADNPASQAAEARALAAHPVPDIDWSRLALGELLGEGASGRIHRATWMDGAGAPQDVAVKLFKGAVTSDGSPLSEMDACIAAGAHPTLIGVRGRVTGHPDGTPALVLGLVDPDWRNLAGPPSLQSCTRDVYAPDTRFDLPAALGMAGGVASAVRQLHAHGITHGDLYAHNILWDGGARALLGDFGAASFFEPSGAHAAGLQRIEARAFGCLLEELIDRVNSPPTDADPTEGENHSAVQALRRLQARCNSPVPAERPSFAEIEDSLEAIGRSLRGTHGA
ncbi:leucine-rich repeat-containing protein kinase family protein [Variovorax dokdonensis]|uniref:Leucine-rich repeat-containing protein kinase family protein n=1 Tax=Variovorax dokdonensis TaxID=344883 RepID=A0ABT7N4L2_9BURK|nr:leucine-rich repeat-containing protein kinase family protein [Variovorax dokdonensis]MDM0042874.1 leucine-rich repeat-containing protein kinase family protein [Variovorax dokdonensis]